MGDGVPLLKPNGVPRQGLGDFVGVGLFPGIVLPYAFKLRLQFFDLSDFVFKMGLLVPWVGASLVQKSDEELLGVHPGDLLGVRVSAAGGVAVNLIEDKSVPRVAMAHVVIEELGGHPMTRANLQKELRVGIAHVLVDKPHKVGDDPPERLLEAMHSTRGQ